MSVHGAEMRFSDALVIQWSQVENGFHLPNPNLSPVLIMTILHNCGGIVNNQIQIMLQSGLFFLCYFEYFVWEGCKDFHLQVGPLSAK